MQQQTYDEANVLQNRMNELNEAISILSGEQFSVLEVNVIMTGNNINKRIKLDDDEILAVKTALESELSEKETEFGEL